jgi:hypothetical protein
LDQRLVEHVADRAGQRLGSVDDREDRLGHVKAAVA